TCHDRTKRRLPFGEAAFLCVERPEAKARAKATARHLPNIFLEVSQGWAPTVSGHDRLLRGRIGCRQQDDHNGPGRLPTMPPFINADFTACSFQNSYVRPAYKIFRCP